MKKIFMIAGCLILSASMVSAESFGTTFGTLTTARTDGMGRGNFLGGVGLADATSVFGRFTYGMSESADGSLKIGLVDPGAGADLELTLGGDFKIQLWDVNSTAKNPFDMAIGGFFEFADFGPVSALQIGGNLIGSYPVALSNGRTLSPYGRFNLRIEKLSLDSKFGGGSDSNLEFGFSGGTAYNITNTIRIFGEFQIDGNDGVFFGIDFNIM